MTLSQVTVYANQIAKQRLGYQAISLTNYDNDNEPQIAAGSKVEIGGALFEAVSNENISGWAGISNSSDVYIKLIVSGATATAEFTDTPPTWSTSKQGWYNGDDRYIGGLYKDGSGNYTDKHLFAGFNEKTVTTGKIRNLAVTTAKIDNSAVSNDKLKKSFQSDGSHSVSATSTWLVPAGWYIMTMPHVTSASTALELYVNGGWHYGMDFSGGVIMSDGTNVRFHNLGSASQTIYYKKLS